MSFISYFVTLTHSVNGFADLPATLVCELGCHVGIHFKQIVYIIYIYTLVYIYIYIHTYRVCLVVV